MFRIIFLLGKIALFVTKENYSPARQSEIFPCGDSSEIEIRTSCWRMEKLFPTFWLSCVLEEKSKDTFSASFLLNKANEEEIAGKFRAFSMINKGEAGLRVQG